MNVSLRDQAIQLFDGNAAAAEHWLNTSNHALGGQAPVDMALTTGGAIEVENLIGRLEHGIFS